MPLLFCLGQHRALVSVQAQLQEGERLFAYLDDIYVVCAPERVGKVYLILEEHLRTKTGSTSIWEKQSSGTELAPSLTWPIPSL